MLMRPSLREPALDDCLGRLVADSAPYVGACVAGEDDVRGPVAIRVEGQKVEATLSYGLKQRFVSNGLNGEIRLQRAAAAPDITHRAGHQGGKVGFDVAYHRQGPVLERREFLGGLGEKLLVLLLHQGDGEMLALVRR